MGMAASQARYLGLTARKTNVEYEGQQINQARTALGNQSATLWNQMLGLSIPTCPNTTDYTTVQYSFSDGYNDYTISNVQSVDKDIDGVRYNKQVTYYYNQDTFKGIQAKNTNPQAQAITEHTYTATVNATGADGSIVVAGSGDNRKFKMNVDDGTGNISQVDVTPTLVDDTSAEYANYLAANNLTALATGQSLYACTVNGKTTYVVSDKDMTDAKNFNKDDAFESQTINDNVNSYYMVGNSKAEAYDANDKEQAAALEQIRNDFPELKDVPDDQIYVYKKTGNQMFFATKADLDTCIASGQVNVKDDRFQISSTIDYQSPLNQYYATTVSQKVENTDYAIMDDASGSGRFSNIKLSTMSDTFNVKSEEITDEKAYNDAMNQYNYDVTCYEKSMADINAKTSVIQEQDRQLELRLKQLETEQKALVTEMDAVKGIISKNVESTFKTFSS